MGSPTGFPKGLDFANCVNVTLVLHDFQVLTGRFRGLLGERDYDDDDDKWKKDDKFCKPPKVDIEVEAVNVESIIYAGTNPEFCDIPISFGLTPAGNGGVTLSFRK